MPPSPGRRGPLKENKKQGLHPNLVLVLLIVRTKATWIEEKFYFLCCILVKQDFKTSFNLQLHQKSTEVDKYPSFLAEGE